MDSNTQYVYASVADSVTLPHLLTAFHSLRSCHLNSVMYVLCLEECVYDTLEQMEYDDVYMISLIELEERYPLLHDVSLQSTPKKYHAILHSFVLHYILINNPLVRAISYIHPYTYWIHIPPHSIELLPLVLIRNGVVICIYCPNTLETRHALLLYQKECIGYAVNRDIPYTEDSIAELIMNVLYGESPYMTLLARATLCLMECVEYTKCNGGKVYIHDMMVYGIYTRYLCYTRYTFACYTALYGSYRHKRSIMHMVAMHKKELARMQYKCTLFGLKQALLKRKQCVTRILYTHMRLYLLG